MANEVQGPLEPWKAIEGSHVFSLYVTELFWLAEDVVRRADSVFEKAPPAEGNETYIRVNPELHSEIYALLASASKIRLLTEPRRKRRDQSHSQYRMLEKRARALGRLLSELKRDEILNLSARHSVEHFDERLDKTAHDLLHGSISLPAHIPMDMAVGDRRAFEALKGKNSGPQIFPMRIYIASERIFANAGSEIELGRLRNQCEAIRDRLQPLMPQAYEGRGASVVVVTRQTF